MSVDLHLTVEDVAAQLVFYTSIQLERATTVGGAYALVTTIALVAGTYYYEYTDAAGDINSWYRYRYYNATGPAASPYNNPFRPDGATRLKVRQKMLEDYRCGMVLTVGAGSSTTKVQTDDYRIKNTVYRDGRGKNTSLYLATGALAGTTRLITTSDVSAGDLSVDLMGGIPDAGDQVEWHWLVLPETANAMFNKAVKRYWFVDRIPVVGVSDTGEYSLDNAGWLTNPRDLTGLWYYPSGSLVAKPWQGSGRWWNYRTDTGVVTISINPGAATGDLMYLEALRQMPELYDDTSQLPGNPSLQLLAALMYDECLRFLLQPGQGGTSEDFKTWRIGRGDHKIELQKLLKQHTPKVNFALPVFNYPQPVNRAWRSR